MGSLQYHSRNTIADPGSDPSRFGASTSPRVDSWRASSAEGGRLGCDQLHVGRVNRPGPLPRPVPDLEANVRSPRRKGRQTPQSTPRWTHQYPNGRREGQSARCCPIVH